MTNWDGEGYSRVSALQRAMADAAIAELSFAGNEHVLDVGCGDGFLTNAVARLVPDGRVVGADASFRMIATAHANSRGTAPFFVVADARRLPFREAFDQVVSFNALHWVIDQHAALAQIAGVLRPGGRALIQMVCAGERTSVEALAMSVARSPSWAAAFDGFVAPFVHVDPVDFRALSAAAGLEVTAVTVADKEWDFGSRQAFAEWCAVGTTAWTDRLPEQDKQRFVDEMVDGYEHIVGAPGIFRFLQMRATLSK